jgi:hypothetical protein
MPYISHRTRMRNREYLQGMRDTNEIIGNILAVVGCIIGAGILVALVTVIVKCLVWLMFSWKV